jgi:hypothetical protein
VGHGRGEGRRWEMRGEGWGGGALVGFPEFTIGSIYVVLE